jgi:hypothetical protein
MSKVDQYDFVKSSLAQGLEQDKPYVKKNFNYISDINQGVYSNSNGLTLLQYDLTGIYNSSELTNTADHFLIIPTMTCVAISNGANLVAPSANSSPIATLKTGNASIIHQCDLMLNGKTVIQLQPYSNTMYNIDLASRMSVDDLKLHGKLRGYASTLDNPNSVTYNVTGTVPTNVSASTPGIANNYPYATASTNSANGTSVASTIQVQQGIQNYNCINNVPLEKSSWYVNTSSNYNNLGTTTSYVNATNFQKELRPYSVVTGNYRVYYDYLYIRLGDILPVMDNIGVVRKYEGILRIYINTGIVSAQITASTVTATSSILTFDPQYTTFTNTCPIMINNLSAITNYAGGATDVTAGFFIANPPNYTFNTKGGCAINFGGAGLSQNFMTSTRYYYSSIVMDSLKLADYLASNQSKTVISKTFLYNTYTNIAGSANFSQLIQSGVRNIRSVIIVPYISASNTNINFAQWASPFDPAGGLGSASISLLNLQVSLGGVQQLYTTLNYEWENFVEQISIYNKASSNEYGIESGLISREWWDVNRFYIVNIRGSNDDDLTARNVTISFLNNVQVAIDIQVFVVYEDAWTVNVATGSVVQQQ